MTFCGTGYFFKVPTFFGSGLIPSAVSIIRKNGTHLQFILTLSGLRCKSISRHLSRNLIALASCSSCVDPNTRMSSAIFFTPGRPESKSHKALSNKSPALQSSIARTLNTYTPSGVNIAVSNLDRVLNGKWKIPLVASKTLKYLASFNW